MKNINNKFLEFYEERGIGNKTKEEQEKNLKEFFANMDDIKIDSYLAQRKLRDIRSGETNGKKH